MGSDVKDLLDRISQEYWSAKQALTAPAMVAKHAYISARMEHIACLHDKLVALVGVEKGMELTVKVMEVAETKYELQQLQ